MDAQARTTLREKYQALIDRAIAAGSVTVAVAHPCDAVSLEGAVEAARMGLIRPILVGPKARIHETARQNGLDISGLPLVDSAHSHDSAAKAVEIVRRGEAEALMKGSLHTDEIMGAVVAHDTGIRTERRISHCFVMDVPGHENALIITDAAVNIVPTLDVKVDIVQNAIDLARTLGVETPKVGVLSAVETVNPKIPSTLDAAALSKMAERGQIRNGLVDGPLAMDNAIDMNAARTKGIKSLVAGQADILVAPNLESGNMLAKELTFVAHAEAGGVVIGAKCPIILTSRSDDDKARLASCAIAALYAERKDR